MGSHIITYTLAHVLVLQRTISTTVCGICLYCCTHVNIKLGIIGELVCLPLLLWKRCAKFTGDLLCTNIG